MSNQTIQNLNWNIISGVLAALSLIIPVIIYLLQKNKKSLSYEITSRASLLSNKEKLEGKIKILFNDIEVENVKLFEIQLKNTGNVAIESSDYEKPITFCFSDENAKLLSCEIIDSTPSNLQTTFTTSTNEIFITPMLINSKDSFTIKIIVANIIEDEVKIEGRIKDIKQIRNIEDSTQSFWILLICLIFTLTGFIRIIISDVNNSVIGWNIDTILNFGLLIVGYLTFSIYTFKNRKMLRMLGIISKAISQK